MVQNIDQKQITFCIFLDLSKAFDTVDHKILIQKLDHYGIRGLPQQLIKSCLDNRLQFTSVAWTTSNLASITCGVPQDFTLGPFLFLLYINDLPLVSNLNTNLFADGTVLISTDTTINTLTSITNIDLEKIDNCMKLNKLTINYKKSQFMLISKKKKFFDKCIITIGNHKVEQVK